jgi:hypothetical protein
MAHVREESGLRAVEFSKRFGALSGFFIGARVRNRRANMFGNEV